MIIVSFQKKNGVFVSASARGHAAHEAHGKDIVCAAVSTLMSFAGELILDYAPSSLFTSDPRNAEATIASTGCSREVQTVYAHLAQDLEALARTYPQNVSMEIKEE